MAETGGRKGATEGGAPTELGFETETGEETGDMEATGRGIADPVGWATGDRQTVANTSMRFRKHS
jgi:hypothetical protein